MGGSVFDGHEARKGKGSGLKIHIGVEYHDNVNVNVSSIAPNKCGYLIRF